jgi:hypothetical protein
VTRGKFRVEDTKSGDAVELDAAPGDPVRLRLPGAEDQFIQVDALDANTRYHILNLSARKELESGEAMADTAEGPIPVDLSQFQKSLHDSKYSFLVAALFPNFTFDENRQPTTKDEKFDNPAILMMLFKNGRPNGYTWLFANAEAQNIVGQTHPELEMHFSKFRKSAGASGSQGLYDYEVQVELKEKATGKVLGSFWAKPGDVTEIPGVSDSLLKSPNVTTDNASSMHARDAVPDGTSSSTALTSAPKGGGNADKPVQGGSEDAATSKTETANSSGRYVVTYLGTTTGNVTFLGFMRDPSVTWIFSGCIIIIAGTLIAFLLVYREVWVYYDSAEKMLYMATVVRGTSPGAHRQFDRYAAQIAAMRTPPT